MGLGIQRTMTLLATSTPEHRNKVRILFYGQSITEQDWSKQVADDLRKRFPDADLEIENRAIGGFASQLLIRPAEHDLYPFYPDLLIFHVYGGNKEYEQIIQARPQPHHRRGADADRPRHAAGRRRSSTENKDKGDVVGRPDEPAPAAGHRQEVRLRPGGRPRRPWLDYLKANHLEPKALLKDGVHLNDHGNFLMARAGRASTWSTGPTCPTTAGRTSSARYEVGKDVHWKDGKLTLEFEGNRVDVIAGATAKAGAAPRC